MIVTWFFRDVEKINAVRYTYNSQLLKTNICVLCCQSRDVDSQFCSCDASVFTVSQFRPCLPSVY